MKFTPVLGLSALPGTLGCVVLICIMIGLLWFSYASRQREGMDAGGSYVMSKVSAGDTPREIWEKVETVGSDGQFASALYDVKIHSREKISCMAPATYNSYTFECDCPEGSDYSDVYGCISKCDFYQKYTADGCVNRCDVSNQFFYDAVLDACLQCPVGTYNDGNNTCLPLPACPGDGQYVDHSGRCSFCPSGQVFNDQGVCVAACAPHQQWVTGPTGGQCMPRCPIQYQYWKAGDAGGSCVDCPPGQVADAQNRCVPSKMTCRPGESYGSGYRCTSVCLEYERWDASFANCVPKCGVIQYYNSDTRGCAMCPMGQISDDKNGCAPPPVEPVPTPNCPVGFTLNAAATACDTVCPYWRYNADDDPTMCELICPVKTQYYDLAVNNGCTDCPVGYIADANNACTLCDSDNGYFMVNGVCAFECPSYKRWNAVTDVCDYNCPDNNTYYVEGKGCQYCPKGYLVDQKNGCNLCDTDNGYTGSGGPGGCKFQCGYWQRWDNVAQQCVNHCPFNHYYDKTTDTCTTCQDVHPLNYILGFNSETNTCTVGGLITAPPTPTPLVTKLSPELVQKPAAPPPPVITEPPPANLSVKLVSFTTAALNLAVTTPNYGGTVSVNGAVVHTFSAGPNVVVTVPLSGVLNTSNKATILVQLLDSSDAPVSVSGGTKTLTVASNTARDNYTPSSDKYLYKITYDLVGGGGGGGSGASTIEGDYYTGCTGGGGGAGQHKQDGIYMVDQANMTNSTINMKIGTGGGGGQGVMGTTGGNSGQPGQPTTLSLSGAGVIATAAGGGGGGGGGEGSGNNCYGGAGGSSDSWWGTGITGNDWANSDNGRARGGSNGSGSGSGGAGSIGGSSGPSPDASPGVSGSGTYTAYYYTIQGI